MSGPPFDCDVAVVGAGPAGATLARAVARQGFDVVLLEKERLPRYKTCAGGVTVRASRLLDFDISPVIERVVHGSHFSYRMGRPFDKDHREPICYMVMRDRFDGLLVRKATEAGARLVEGARVRAVTADAEGCTIALPDGALRARFVVGADGANSVVARAQGLAAGGDADVALEAEVEVAPPVLERWASRVGIDVGVVAGGYAWVFPKGQHLSIGVAGLKRYAPQLKEYYRHFLDWLALGEYRVRSFRGHHIPLRDGAAPLSRGRALVVGDAAGLADPFSGEGIYHAIRSAQLAAPVVAENLRAGTADLSGYDGAVAREMLPDLQAARVLVRAFTAMPAVWVTFMRRLQRPWRAGCNVLRGDYDWTHVLDRTGPFRRLLRFLDR